MGKMPTPPTFYFFTLLLLSYRYLRRSISILRERSVLVSIVLISISQFVHESMTQHTLTLTMYEHDTFALVMLVLLERTAEVVELIVEDICRSHTCSCLQQFIGMKVYNKDVIAFGATVTMSE